MPREPAAPAPAPSAEARRLIDEAVRASFAVSPGIAENALLAYVAGLEAEVERLRDLVVGVSNFAARRGRAAEGGGDGR